MNKKIQTGTEFNKSNFERLYCLYANGQYDIFKDHGLNSPNDGYNFIRENKLIDYLNYKYTIADYFSIITIPEDAIVIINGDIHTSDKVNMGKIKKLNKLELFNDEEFCKKVVVKYKFALKYVKNKTPEICKMALEYDGTNIKFVKNPTPRNVQNGH